MRSLQTITFEAIVIGIMNVFISLTLSMFIKNPMVVLFITGALIHIILEFLGLNEWWCKVTY